MSDESVVARIQKLLALAMNNSNEAEAELAMTKARALMLKHAVEDWELAGKKEKLDVDVVKIDIGRRFENWMRIVQSAISSMYDGKNYRTSYQDKDVATVVLAKSDVELFQASYAFVVKTILREAAIVTKGRTMAANFRLGAAIGLADAVQAAKNAEKAVQAPADSTSTALVLVRKHSIEVAAKQMFPNSRPSTLQYSVSDAAAYAAGHALGSSLAQKEKKKLNGE